MIWRSQGKEDDERAVNVQNDFLGHVLDQSASGLVQSETISDVMRDRIVQRLKTKLKFLNSPLKVITTRKNKVAALLADLKSSSVPAVWRMFSGRFVEGAFLLVYL